MDWLPVKFYFVVNNPLGRLAEPLLSSIEVVTESNTAIVLFDYGARSGQKKFEISVFT